MQKTTFLFCWWFLIYLHNTQVLYKQVGTLLHNISQQLFLFCIFIYINILPLHFLTWNFIEINKIKQSHFWMWSRGIFYIQKIQLHIIYTRTFELLLFNHKIWNIFTWKITFLYNLFFSPLFCCCWYYKFKYLYNIYYIKTIFEFVAFFYFFILLYIE